MGIQCREIKLFEQQYICDWSECKGQMLPTGITDDRKEERTTYYQHKCNVCDRVEVFDQKYPVEIKRYI